MFESYGKFWSNYFDFSGVSSRKDYWCPFLINVIVILLLLILAGGAAEDMDEEYAGFMGLVSVLYYIAIIIPSISVAVRRLHDTNRSGGYYCLSFIPFGILVLLVMLAEDSVINNNKYIQMNLSSSIGSYCSKCGNKLSSDMAFCSKCGLKLK